MRFSCLVVLVALLVGLNAGCQSGTVKAVVPLAGGGQIMVPMTAKGPPPGEAEGYRAEVAALIPGKEPREAQYDFRLLALKEPNLKRIVIEDLSDEKAVTLLDDANPQFTDRHWRARSEMVSADDPRLKWVFQITTSIRVYRFTLTTTDSRKITFDHITVYPPFIKGAMRAKWGEKY